MKKSEMVDLIAEDIDSELADIEIGDSLSPDKHSKTIGVGCFYFEDEADNKKKS